MMEKASLPYTCVQRRWLTFTFSVLHETQNSGREAGKCRFKKQSAFPLVLSPDIETWPPLLKSFVVSYPFDQRFATLVVRRSAIRTDSFDLHYFSKPLITSAISRLR